MFFMFLSYFKKFGHWKDLECFSLFMLISVIKIDFQNLL